MFAYVKPFNKDVCYFAEKALQSECCLWKSVTIDEAFFPLWLFSKSSRFLQNQSLKFTDTTLLYPVNYFGLYMHVSLVKMVL